MSSQRFGEMQFWRKEASFQTHHHFRRRIMNKSALKIYLVAFLILLSFATAASAQALQEVGAIETSPGSNVWSLNIAFTKGVDRDRILHIFLLKTDAAAIVELTNIKPADTGLAGPPVIYTADPVTPLAIIINEHGTRSLHYQLWARLRNSEPGKEDLSLNQTVTLRDENIPLDAPAETRAKVKDFDDSDVYVSGELDGAHKAKTRYTVGLKYQHYRSLGRWQWTPVFFKLNASTDPDADPDKMEIGTGFRYISRAGYFDQKMKLESERDFDNTNLISDTRFTFLPHAVPKGRKNVKLFFNPFLGGEFGKNLHSPLKAAEGDGIARLLAGADVRVAFWLNKDSDDPEINWTTSYVRRWLLTDELSFEADKDGKLQLQEFGRSPRDYVSSKVAYSVRKFFDIFLEYEWGQVPPSYKFVDHRFRLGFAYKFRFTD
jgi:hypothetical protein